LKFIGVAEYDPEDLDKIVEKFAQSRALREKFPDRFPKTIFGPFVAVDEPKTFVVYETDNPDQLTNHTLHYTPLLREKYTPIQEAAKFVELYLQSKK